MASGCSGPVPWPCRRLAGPPRFSVVPVSLSLSVRAVAVSRPRSSWALAASRSAVPHTGTEKTRPGSSSSPRRRRGQARATTSERRGGQHETPKVRQA
jgi:hypothetical protein